MTAPISLRGFEEVALKTQNTNPLSPIIINTDGAFGRNLSAPERQKQLNQKTWRVFLHSLIDTIGMDKFLWICRRYQFDPKIAESQGKPLLEKHVRLFSIGSAQVMTRDIKRLCAPGTKIKQLTRSEIQEKLKRSQPFRGILGKYINPMDIYGTPTEKRAWYIHDPLLMDREKQLLFSDAADLSHLAFIERFCKATVNRELVEKEIVPASGSDGNLDFYTVHKVIIAGGLLACALKPLARDSTLKPLIVFRSTQMAISRINAVDTWLEDALKKIGEAGSKAAKPQLDRLMNDPSFLPPGTQAETAGFSLAGTYLQRLIPDHVDKICSAYFWGDPSVDAETAEQFAKKMRSSPRQTPLSVSIYRTEGDFCHKAGEKHLFWNVDDPNVSIELFEVNHENKEIEALSLHSFKVYDNNQLNYRIRRVTSKQELFDHLDNTRRGPEVLWYERVRRIWGRFLYGFIYCSQAIVKGFGKIFGIQILRSS